MQTAAAYIRVSTEDQTEYSPDAQLRAIKSYCEKNNYFLDPAYIFADEGYSGRKAEKRPAFMRMIGTAKKKPAPFQAILVHKFDRFARSREDSVVYKSLLRKECGVSVISVTETIENDKISLIMESMLEAMAEYYSINLAEEVKKGMTEKARRGEPMTTAPFGYKIENKKLLPDPREAEAVRRIFSDFVSGESYFGIAHALNDAGFRSKRGNRVDTRMIQYMIHNPVYAGYIRWTPTGHGADKRYDFTNPDTMIVKGQHEPLIAVPTFEAAQKRAAEIRAIRMPYYRAQTNKSHWLVGLLRCSCGYGMSNSNGYFVCTGYVHGQCTERSSVRVDVLEAAVLQHIREAVTNPGGITYERVRDSTVDKQIDTAIAEAEMRMRRTKKAYERGIDTLEEYALNKSRLQADLDKWKAKRSPPGSESFPDSIRNTMRDMLEQPGNRASIARRFIKQILWDKRSQHLTISYFTC